MDFITIWISSLISSRKASSYRMSLAAAIGGLYGVFAVICPLSSVSTYITAFSVSTLMCLCSFGLCGGIFQLFKHSTLIWGCGALLGGFMTAVLSIGETKAEMYVKSGGKLSFWLAVSVLLVYMTVRIICSQKDKRTVKVRLKFLDSEISFTALCDSGNLLRDPISGSSVIIVSSHITLKLCGRHISNALLNMDTKVLEKEGISIRLIPRKTADGSGIIAGFIPNNAYLINGRDKKEVKCVIAPIPCPKDYFAGHSAAVPSGLL